MRIYEVINHIGIYSPEDTSGEYCVRYIRDDGFVAHLYYKDGEPHREDGAAMSNNAGSITGYYLNGKRYHHENDFTDESWTRFCKLITFQ